MRNSTRMTGASGDLFEGIPVPASEPAMKGERPPELTAARALCNRIRRKQAPTEKQRIAHLICLNLVSMLKHERRA